eukprot:15430755-Alexandrium_andersonii.AAC.1
MPGLPTKQVGGRARGASRGDPGGAQPHREDYSCHHVNFSSNIRGIQSEGQQRMLNRHHMEEPN